MNIMPILLSNPDIRQLSKSRVSRVLTVIGFMFLLCLAGSWSNQYLFGQLWPLDFEGASLMIISLVSIYTICMILPFMPAIELGLILLAMLDIQGVLWLYLITVIALTISYGIGQSIPVRILKKAFEYLHCHKAGNLLCDNGECNETEQIDRFIAHAPKQFVPFLLRHRYCILGISINTPGNMIIGGAGGIAMMTGMSRAFGFEQFVLSVFIAVSPLPILAILSKLMIVG